MMKYPISIDPQVYEMLRNLLTKGLVTQDGKSVDFSKVQRIDISNGSMKFNPPATIAADFGPIKLRTTVSSLTVRDSGVRIEIDNSPLDLELRPK
jgi:hypothetical protein